MNNIKKQNYPEFSSARIVMVYIAVFGYFFQMKLFCAEYICVNGI